MGYRSVLQKTSAALMVPIVILPIAAIYFALGTQTGIAPVLAAGKAILLTYLPLLFAIGVALGFCQQDGMAALSAAIGWTVMSEVMKSVNVDSDAGVLGGLLIGAATAALWRFRDVRFPEWLGLFSGKRFVPVITSLAALFLGLGLGVVWPPIAAAMTSLGQWVFAAGATGALVYGIINRLLIPTGLHHIMQNLIEYVLGSYTAAGKILHGEVPRFFAGDPTSGFILGGYYIVMMFSVPAACLAITHESRPENRRRVGGLMATAAVSSMMLGITEPAEFSFMFAAPLLYAVHAVLTGAALWVSWALGIRHWGYALPMYITNWRLSQNAWLIIPVGLAFALVYYALFRFLIRRFNLPTLGRRGPLGDDQSTGAKATDRAREFIAALGGPDNLLLVDACVTRLRLKVRRPDALAVDALRRLGASGVAKVGPDMVQVVVGTQAETIRDELRAALAAPAAPAAPIAPGAPAAADGGAGPAPMSPAQEGEAMVEPVVFVAPMSGRLLALQDVPDQVFAQGMVGQGFAIEPCEGKLVAPVAGRVLQVFPGGHAVVLGGPRGLEIILHIGLDTVELAGRGFHPVCRDGDEVVAGQTLVEFDREQIRAAGRSLISPCVIANSETVAGFELTSHGEVKAGSGPVLSVTVK
ncbi:MAG: glucose PTS transporter subunit IIA [Chloroflexota bacterium]